MFKFQDQDSILDIMYLKDSIEAAYKKVKDSVVENINNNTDNKYGEAQSKPQPRASDYFLKTTEKINDNSKAASAIEKDLKDENIPLNLEFNEENILQAILYSEILGKPKAKTRRRW